MEQYCGLYVGKDKLFMGIINDLDLKRAQF